MRAININIANKLYSTDSSVNIRHFRPAGVYYRTQWTDILAKYIMSFLMCLTTNGLTIVSTDTGKGKI